MSAEHTRLTPIPEGTAFPVGLLALNDRSLVAYEEPVELPSKPNQQAICERHLETGVQSDMLGEFWWGGCDFNKPLEEGIIRYQFVCDGKSHTGRCGLTLTQYDSNGNELNSVRLNQKLK